MRSCIARFATVVTLSLAVSAPVLAETTKRPKYGCFAVTAESLNVRYAPYSSAKKIGVVSKGDVLIKRRPWCTFRGFWCAVKTESGREGYVDKNFMKVAPCPARLAEVKN